MTGIVKEMVGMSTRKNRDVDFDGGRAESGWLDDDDDDDGALREILLRLPVKSVIRFQSVSKSWLSLISSDRFRRLHTLRRHKSPPSLILELHDRQTDSPDIKVSLFYSNAKRIEKLTRMIAPFDINVMIKKFKILSSSNGLILIRCDDDYYVHNPTTMQSKKLSIAHNDNFIHFRTMHLVFDPSESLHYNVVCVRSENERPLRYQIEVFSSESGMWRVCVEPFTIGGGQILNNLGSCARYKSLVFLIDSECVYCFNIVKNVSELIVCPLPNLGKAVYSHSIQESNDCLYYCALLEDRVSESWAALWKLRVNMDDPRYSEWEIMFHHRLHLKWLRFVMYTFIAETRTMLIHYSRKIVAYYFRHESYREVLELEEGISYANVLRFGETLALL